MKKTETLATNCLQPGMQVAAAVVDAAGRVLLPAGAELSESTIASLGRRGIAEVAVAVEVEVDPAEREARRQRVLAQLDRLFRRAGEGDATLALYRAVADYRLEGQP